MNSHPSSSRPSAAFDRLAEPVRRWIWNKNWDHLRDIQERAIPILLDSDNDVIISAATAGGKTEAAFLPLISTVLQNPSEDGFDLVYIGPLRALINDQFERLEDLCSKTYLPVYPWHGDISQGVKLRARKNPRGVLLITPESLEALFILRGLEIPALFMATRTIVIDELHALLDNERGIHLRSLLKRMELAVGHRVRRVGLSATLGEMTMAREYLRPEASEAVQLLESQSGTYELLAQIRGYSTRYKQNDESDKATQRAVAEHIFSKLRGKSNLVFAESRQNVEWYADALREMSNKLHVPVEFFPHHANLSREHRLDLEGRLKSNIATTAVCTSTLELGIDIGDIACVAQIGAPYSVASLRQRLGRSGRRASQPAILRMYSIEMEPNVNSHSLDRLHLGLVRSIAMLELLVKEWCEPPAPQALHLSTLTHQILSVIVEHGGIAAKQLYTTLCEQGPFRLVDHNLFAQLLRHLGRSDVALIEQAPDGSLLLGRQGEKLVEHYSFYAVFQTQAEYRIVADSKPLGTLPVMTIYTPGMTIIFSGRRWRITAIHDREKVIEVTADRVGRPPRFGGGFGPIHDHVVETMKEVFEGVNSPNYLDETAARLLEDARSEFRRLNLDRRTICEIGNRNHILATWVGTIKTSTLALALRAKDHTVTVHDGFLDVRWKKGASSLEETLEEIARSAPTSPEKLLSGEENFMSEKFHPYLSSELLLKDAASSRIDLSALPELARNIIRSNN